MVRILVEGNDEHLIRTLVTSKLGYDNSLFAILPIDGNYKKVRLLEPKIREFNDNDDVVLVILDADQPPNDGFINVSQELDSIKNDLKLNFEYFLLPNHQSNGNLEDVLEKIINPEHLNLFTCFDNYLQCINSNNVNGKYHLPIKKSKIYAYVDTLTPKKDKELIKKGNFFYSNPDYWNLDSDYLDSLYNFLRDKF